MMWQIFIKLKGNYDKILFFVSLKHTSVWCTVTLINNMSSYKQPGMRQASVSSTLSEVT